MAVTERWYDHPPTDDEIAAVVDPILAEGHGRELVAAVKLEPDDRGAYLRTHTYKLSVRHVATTQPRRWFKEGDIYLNLLP